MNGNHRGENFVLTYTFSYSTIQYNTTIQYSTTGRTAEMDYTGCRRSRFGHIGHHHSNSNCAVVSVKDMYLLSEDDVTPFQKHAY